MERDHFIYRKTTTIKARLRLLRCGVDTRRLSLAELYQLGFLTGLTPRPSQQHAEAGVTPVTTQMPHTRSYDDIQAK